MSCRLSPLHAAQVDPKDTCLGGLTPLPLLLKKVLVKQVVSQEYVGFIRLTTSIRNVQLWLFLESVYSNRKRSEFRVFLSNTHLFIEFIK